MKRLSDLPLEVKCLATAALIFGGIAVLSGLTYLVAAHSGAGGYMIGVSDIAALYTGPGTSMTTLFSLAHIHLLGLFSVFSIVGFIFIHSRLSAGWKIFWSVLPYVAFLVDVSGWFLTKLFAFAFVYFVIIGGTVFCGAVAVMILVSLYELWLVPAASTAK